jgi:hypothetical protein
MPDFLTSPSLGIIEIGVFAGLAGLFLFAFGKALAAAPIIAKNHPYLEESIHHHLH